MAYQINGNVVLISNDTNAGMAISTESVRSLDTQYQAILSIYSQLCSGPGWEKCKFDTNTCESNGLPSPYV